MNFKSIQGNPADFLLLTTLLQSYILSAFSALGDLPDQLTESKFQRCPKGSVHDGQRLTTMDGRSPLACLSRCAELAACASVNVCPKGESGRVTCSLMTTGRHESCDHLTAAASPSCFFAKKTSPDTTQAAVETTTQPIVCQNDGVSNGTHCACPIQYGGLTCDRYIRDCSEAYENGHQNNNANGVYLIQPIKSPSPFHVYCIFGWGGITRPLYRLSSSITPNSWDEAKAGLGDDISSMPDASDAEFFIGLEKLHQITRQANYNQHIHIFYNNWADQGGAFYDNFTVGSEQSSYAVTYSQYYPKTDAPADNGLNATPPVVFCTDDHDTNGCAVSRGAPGWYGADCAGYSMFLSNLQWPVQGVDVDVVFLAWSLVRISPFYENL